MSVGCCDASTCRYYVLGLGLCVGVRVQVLGVRVQGFRG